MIQLTLFVAFIAAAIFLQLRHPANLSPTLARIVSMGLMATKEIVKVPTVNVQGAGSCLEGAAAVLGASNIVKWAQQPPVKKK